MNCANCGKRITDNSISEDNYFFCNTFCRYEWRKNGKPSPFESLKNKQNYISPVEIDLDFPIDPIGFEGRNFFIRPSYWTAPKVFLDGKKLKPKKRKWFTRTRDYSAISNFGKDVNIRIKYRMFDMVPNLYIDQQEFQIAPPLTFWEYIWICLPVVLMFGGGAIGGMIGGLATYTNSILMRKLKNIILRYMFTGLTTFIAYSSFIHFIGFVNPFITNHDLPINFNAQLKKEIAEMNRNCPQMIDEETRLDSMNLVKEKTLQYYYSLVKRSKKDVDINAFSQFLKPNLIQHLRTNEQVRFMRENEVTMVYSYSDKKGIKIVDIPITPHEYK